MNPYIQSLLIITLEILCCRIFFQAFAVNRKENKKFMNSIIIIVLILLSFVMARIFKSQMIIRLLLVTGVIAFCMYLIFKISILKALVLSFLYQGLLLIVDYVTVLALVMCFGDMDIIRQGSELMGIMLVFLSKSVLFLIVAVMKQCNRSKNAIIMSNREWVRFLFFPVFTIFIVAAMTNSVVKLNSKNVDDIYFIIAAGLIVMNIVVFHLINDILTNEHKMRDNELFKQQVAGQMELYHSISENFDRQRRKTHEYKNQILCIDALIEKENYTELKKYVNNITGKLNKELDMINTNNVIVNAVLNTKYQEAVDKGILFVLQINDLADIRVKDEDIVTILSNLLDNAIEACEKCDNKIIKLKFILENGEIVLSVKNTYTGDLSYVDGELVTNKSESKEEHGIGIHNIISTIKKYDGKYLIKCHDGQFMFTVII